MAQQGDYIGFSFGGVHSSELGIVRVSDGSRFEENLLPNFQDKTATVSGKDGIYYFGSDNQQKEITLSFALFSKYNKKRKSSIKYPQCDLLVG